jgi:hypothetical protein
MTVGHQHLHNMKEPITLEQFKKTNYYTVLSIVIPLLNMRLDKVDYMKNGKYDSKKLDKALERIYNENINRLK